MNGQAQTDGLPPSAVRLSKSTRIKIAHVIYRFDYGGLENGLVNLINGLAPAEFEHAVIALTESTEFRRRLPETVAVHELHKPPGKGIWYLFRLSKLLRQGGFDILHTRNLPCLESQLAGMLAGIPVRIHGEHGWDVHDLRGTNRRYRALRRLFRPLVRRYVVVSGHLEDYLAREIGISARRIQRICNGVDTARFTPADRSPDRAEFVVGSVGRLEAVKDFPTLVRAFAILSRRVGPRARLLIVGDGSQRDVLRRYILTEGITDGVVLTGARSDIPEVLKQIDVFVLTSLAEGISNTILEAMASGLPVIATAVGGNSELVVDGQTGFLVAPGDATAIADRLENYCANPALAARHGHAGRLRAVERFSIAAMINAYADLYRGLCNRIPVRR